MLLLSTSPSLHQARRGAHAPAELPAGSLLLAPERWRAYFEAIATGPARLAAVDVIEPPLDDARRALALPLRAISYDPARGMLELDLGIAGTGLRHFISEPREIHVWDSCDGPTELRVHDASGICTRICLSANGKRIGDAPVAAVQTPEGHARPAAPPRAAARARYRV
jgi:Family of unknown function (DUF5335)